MTPEVVVVVTVLVGATLALSAALSLIRLVRGPSLLERVLAVDVLLAIVVGGLIVDMALGRHTENLTLVVVISLVGFVASVTVARFVTDRRTREQ